MPKNCITYSCILGAPNTLGNFLFAEKHRLGENLPHIFRYLGSRNTLDTKMYYIFGIFRPLRINHVCGNFRPHGIRVTNQGSPTSVSLVPLGLRSRGPGTMPEFLDCP